ncbi:unnamed protein product [Calicophoron daubneyi]|uniref:Sema domain-containing protein n=1 Tax=Calicophoron daubneyi TaxID=300641 RepID=A0AAV2TK26_CALDB
MIDMPEQNSIYVVGNNNTLLRLHIDSLRQMASFQLPYRPSASLCLGNPEVPCEEQSAFNLLMKSRNGENFWYCYVYQTSYMKNTIIPNADSARCEIPAPLTLASQPRLVQWENSVYSSLDLRKPGVHLMADDGFLYTAGWFYDALHFHRVRLPNMNGIPNWDDFLTTPSSNEYIREPAAFITAFETGNEVYFLFREAEPPSCASRVLDRRANDPVITNPVPDRAKIMKPTVTVTRLARVCKGDPGGHPNVNEGEFTSFAKITVECGVFNQTESMQGDDGGKAGELKPKAFLYTYAIAALWDSVDQILYVSFLTTDGNPRGAAVCAYAKNDIEESFKGDLASSLSPLDLGEEKSMLNSFPDICSRLNSHKMTHRELNSFRVISRSYLHRTSPVRPIGNRPLLTNPAPGEPLTDNRELGWYSLNSDHVAKYTVLYLAQGSSIERYILTPSTKGDIKRPCLMDRLTLSNKDNSDETISQIYLTPSSLAQQMYILTTKHVIRLPTSDFGCDRYVDRFQCIRSKNPYCVWNSLIRVCETADFHHTPNSPPHSDRKQMQKDIQDLKFCTEHQNTAFLERFAHWSLLAQVDPVTTGRSSVPHSLPCAQILGGKQRGLNQSLNCWCRPRLNTSDDDPFPVEVYNCTMSPSWSPWSGWSACSTTCGPGIRTRSRRCDSPGPVWTILPDGSFHRIPCSVEEDGISPSDTQLQLEYCALQPLCPESANEQPRISQSPYHWGPWGTCSSQCGWGLKERKRLCAEKDNLSSCSFVGYGLTENQVCANHTCARQSIQTRWMEWLLPSSDSLNLGKSHARHRIRFVCSAPHAIAKDLKVNRIQFTERKCASSKDCPQASGNPEIGQLKLNAELSGSDHFARQWSNWGPWSSCPGKCTHLSGVILSEVSERSKTYHSVPLYSHRGMQYRQRSCMFGTLSACPGGVAMAYEERSCPPVSACHSGWSCWSEWSRCLGSSVVEKWPPVGCEWKTDGSRKRTRKCITGENEFLTDRISTCSGPEEITERCARVVGGDDICKARAAVLWSPWSPWVACKQNTKSGELSHESSAYLKNRTRSCISVSTVTAIRPHVVGEGACFGPWRQYETCGKNALQIAAVSTGVILTGAEFSLSQLFLIGSLSLLIAILSTCLLILLGYRCCFCHTRQPRAGEQNKSGLNAHLIDSGLHVIDKPTPASHLLPDSGPILNRTLSVLEIAAPPQPILTLPNPVKADILASTPVFRRRRGSSVEQPVYDSVASQDLPGISEYPEQNYHNQSSSPFPAPMSDQTGLLSRPLRLSREFWSLPRTAQGRARMEQDLKCNEQDRNGGEFDPLFKNDRMVNSFTMGDSPENVQTRSTRQKANHEIGLGYLSGALPRPKRAVTPHFHPRIKVKDTFSHPCRHPIADTRPVSEMDPTENRSSSASENQQHNTDSEFTHPLQPLDEEPTQSTEYGADQPIPPPMPILHLHGEVEVEPRMRTASPPPVGRDSVYSKRGRADSTSAASDVYSICFERPTNPHLRDPVDPFGYPPTDEQELSET